MFVGTCTRSNKRLIAEERCEPSFPLFRNTGTRRFCPDIHDWKELDNYEIGDGYGERNPMADDETTTVRNRYDSTKNYDRYRRPTKVTPTVNNKDDDDDVTEQNY
jgi:hypothetical protein